MTKKRIAVLRIIAFIAFLLVSFVILSSVFTPENGGMDSSVAAAANGIFYERERSIDAVFLGDSEAYASISPMYLYENFGVVSYVSATSSQKLTDSYSYASGIFEKQKPSAVFLEANAVFRTYSFVHALMSRGERILPLLKYHDRWKDLADRLLFGKTESEYRDIMKGFHYNTSVKSYGGGEYMTETDKVMEIPAVNKEQLEELLRLCRKNGSELVLFSAPSPANWSSEKHNAVEAWAKKNSVGYIDFNLHGSVDIDWKKETYDGGDHINYYGALKVSRAMGKYIEDELSLPDRRQDPDYLGWSEELAKYKAAVA